MPQENELLAQRRANMEALAALGVDLYPQLQELAASLADDYGAAPGQIENDVLGLADGLLRRRMIAETPA